MDRGIKRAGLVLVVTVARAIEVDAAAVVVVHCHTAYLTIMETTTCKQDSSLHIHMLCNGVRCTDYGCWTL